MCRVTKYSQDSQYSTPSLPFLSKHLTPPELFKEVTGPWMSYWSYHVCHCAGVSVCVIKSVCVYVCVCQSFTLSLVWALLFQCVYVGIWLNCLLSFTTNVSLSTGAGVCVFYCSGVSLCVTYYMIYWPRYCISLHHDLIWK